MGSARLLIATPLAAVITIALFLVMRGLIVPDNKEIEEPGASASIKITRPERDENVNRRDRNKPDRPQKQEAPPPPPPMELDPQVTANANSVAMRMPDFNADVNLGNLNAPSDRSATPIVRVPPQYPERAAQRGVEGWVLVEFTITPAGGVESPVVVDADPRSIFDRSALRAIQRWKYRPKIVDGSPVYQYGIQQLITYELEK